MTCASARTGHFTHSDLTALGYPVRYGEYEGAHHGVVPHADYSAWLKETAAG